jgi:hypothetical protein
VDMKASPLSRPCPNFGAHRRAVIVDDEVTIQLRWDRGLNTAQKTQKLLMPVALLALGDDLPAGHIQSCKEGCGAMAHTVVWCSFGSTKTHGQ